MKKIFIMLCFFYSIGLCDTEMHYTILKYENFSSQKKAITSLIQTKSSFILTNVKKFSPLIEKLEELINDYNMTCRIYTRNRAWIVLGGALLPIVGKPVASLGFPLIIIHNLITLNPNYEIAKDYLNDRLILTYQY